MQEVIKYSDHYNNPSGFNEWLCRQKNASKFSQTKLEHIIDYLVNNPKNLSRSTYKQLSESAEKWSKSLFKKGEHIKESPDDTEIILDFKDGYKIVKLVGENAYKREGFLMSHCVASYANKDVEVYSLRDTNNMPHCTIEKDKQIKGKGNREINPKYIDYVVKFLEWSGMEVRDSEMKNLGYVNVEGLIKEGYKFPRLYKEKYFFKDDLYKVPEKDNLSFWSVFDLFEISLSGKVKFNFDLAKIVGNNKKLATDSNKIAVTNDNKIAATNYNQIAATEFNQIAANHSNQIVATYCNQIAATYQNRIATNHSNQIVATEFNRIATNHSNQIVATEFNQIATNHDNQIAATEFNQIAATYRNQIAATRRNQIAATNDNKIAIENNNILALKDNNEIKAKENNVIATGGNSKVKAGKGSLIVLYEKDETGKIKNHKAFIIDGKEYKENVWYTLKDGDVIEVRINDIKGRV